MFQANTVTYIQAIRQNVFSQARVMVLGLNFLAFANIEIYCIISIMTSQNDALWEGIYF